MRRFLFCLLIPVFFSGCYKKFLDEKQNDADVLLEDVPALQALLDYTPFMNASHPVLGEISSDQFFIADATWLAYPVTWSRNAYIWKADLFESIRNPPCYDWAYLYRTVFYANVALDGAKGKFGNDWELLKGNAFFYRAFSFYQLLQLFAPVYNSQSANAELGIALRLSPNIDEPTTRSSVEKCYQQVIEDLVSAQALLPETPVTNYRPSRSAAHALLARVYLALGDYENAHAAADASLQVQSRLLDFNLISDGTTYPMPLNNPEILFQSTMYVEPFAQASRTIGDDFLALYETGDRRRTLYFRNSGGRNVFRGSYSGSTPNFTGPTTGEMYLIRAECRARQQDADGALADLDTLRKYRFIPARYAPLTASTAEEVLDLVLKERSLELVSRGLRWTDLRRLSQDPQRRIILSRTVAGNTYTLPPGDSRYVMPIPEEVIELTGIPQNIR